jgi:hypothetical protein
MGWWISVGPPGNAVADFFSNDRRQLAVLALALRFTHIFVLDLAACLDAPNVKRICGHGELVNASWLVCQFGYDLKVDSGEFGVA